MCDDTAASPPPPPAEVEAEGGTGSPTPATSTDNCGGDDEYRLETAPFDQRFPNQNQTKHCYTSFLDYKRCIKLRGESYSPCTYFLRVYKSLCPNSWVAKWEEQIEAGTFPAKI